MIGHVTAVQPRSKEQKESQLSIAFQQMTLKNGEQVQLPLSIQAVVAPPEKNATPPSGGNEVPSSGGAPSGNTGSMGGRGGVSGGNPSGQGNSQAPQGTAENTSSPARPPITADTTGVVGISNLSLSQGTDASAGSMLTSEKNNVKLEDGTMFLLRVSPAAQPGQATPKQ